MSIRGSDICLILVAIIFPPAAAAFITGCSCDLLINICLTMYVSVDIDSLTKAKQRYAQPRLPAGPLGASNDSMVLNMTHTNLTSCALVQHAFWLIYRKMKAEEQYGHGGYHYIGNGQYEPAQGELGGFGAPAGNYAAMRPRCERAARYGEQCDGDEA
ncbi:hypothetical protein EWM64_g10308 [Hericium alpestre]|uniref:Uncharacterized protein n=1 Tax=Hericium alpestre TaxID=135208 RepID=A0A4Y9ZH11_9AGAM|nr:hypothetical protein EWM64_g10308 [Hericium alpestre]